MSGLLSTQLAELLAALIALATLLLLLQWQERRVSRLVAHRWGWRAVLLTGWLGVPVHELSHLALARLFGHRIIAWRLFEPDPSSTTLGYVRHACSRHTPWQRAAQPLIALAPLLGGGLLLAALLWWMLPAQQLPLLVERVRAMATTGSVPHLLQGSAAFAHELAAAVWQGRTPLLPLQLYLAICISCHLAPSRADLASSLPSLMGLLVLLIGGGAIAAVFGWAWPVRKTAVLVLGPLLALLVAVGMFQGLFAAVVIGCVRRRRGLRLDSAPPRDR